MVVGLAQYKDTSEAHPLDKKTLNAIALRSLFSGISYSSETANSIGWLWAIAPGLKKIHTNEEDLALCYGHNLEYTNADSALSPFAMGVLLSLEQQKADLEVIRGARTALSSTSDFVGSSLFNYILIPLIGYFTIQMALGGSMVGPILFGCILFALQIILRMVSIRIGYAKGVRAVEQWRKQSEALKKAGQVLGLFMIGALVVSATFLAPNLLADYSQIVSASRITYNLFAILPCIVPVLVTWLMYTLLSKKNASLGTCVGVVVIIAAVCVALLMVIDASFMNIPFF